MAFSTQREFINIGFINAEPDKPLKKRSDAAIKNIESVTDARAWSLDKHDRSRFLAEIVQETRSPPVTLVDDVKAKGEPTTVSNIGNTSDPLSELSTTDLLSQIATLTQAFMEKDTELENIKSSLMRISHRSTEMETIVEEKNIMNNQLREAEARIAELADSNESKEEALKHLRYKLNQLSHGNEHLQNRLSTNYLEKDDDQLTIQTQMLEIIRERDLLKKQLHDLSGLQGLLKQLKKRAEYSTILEKKNDDLIKEMHFLKNANNVLIDSHFDPEIEAERNFYRNQVLIIEALEAELIIYKTKYNEMEFQSRQMKQQLVQEDYGHRRILDFECMKSTLEKELDIADHQIKELINTIKNQNRHLKTKDNYFDSINQKIRLIDDEIKSVQVLVMKIINSCSVIDWLPDAESLLKENLLLKTVNPQQAIKDELENRLNLETEVDELKQIIEKLTAEIKVQDVENLESESFEVVGSVVNFLPEKDYYTGNFDKNEGDSPKVDRKILKLDDESLKPNAESSKQDNKVSELIDENCKLNDELNLLRQQLSDIMKITESIDNEREANICLKNDLDTLQKKFQEFSQKVPENSEIENKDTEKLTFSECSFPVSNVKQNIDDEVLKENQRWFQKDKLQSEIEQLNAQLQLSELSKTDKDIYIEKLEKKLYETDEEFLKYQEQLHAVGGLQSQLDQINSELQLCKILEEQKSNKIVELEKVLAECQEENAELNQNLLASQQKLQMSIEKSVDVFESKQRTIELEKLNKTLEEDLTVKSQTISISRATMRQSIEHIKNCIEDHCNDKVNFLKIRIEELQSENVKLKYFREKVLSNRPCECNSLTVMNNKLDMICQKILICGLGSLQFDELFYAYNELYMIIVKVKDIDSIDKLDSSSAVCEHVSQNDIHEVTLDNDPPQKLCDDDTQNFIPSKSLTFENSLEKNFANNCKAVTFIEASFQSGTVPAKTIKLRSHSCKNIKKKKWI